MRYYVTIGGREVEVELNTDGVRVDGQALRADLEELDGTELRTLLLGEGGKPSGGRSHRILVARTGPGQWSLHMGGRHLHARVLDERTRALDRLAAKKGPRRGPSSLRAPMPGLIVKVEVEPGEVVRAGQGVVIMEAMKMENELTVEGEGRVRRVLVAPGQAVERDEVLIELEPLQEEGRSDDEEPRGK